MNGSVAGVGAYNQLSDIRYKKEIKALAGSLAKVLAVRGISYKWIDEEKYGDKTQIGVTAQEIEKIVPEVVDAGNDGIKRVKYSDLVPLVIEAMKEQESEMARLKAENRDIKEKAATIEAENKDIKATLDIMKKSLCEKDQSASFCH